MSFDYGCRQIGEWINAEKRRYYKLFLSCDLFGHKTLIRAWGGINSKTGGSLVQVVDDDDKVDEMIKVVERERRWKGYILVS